MGKAIGVQISGLAGLKDVLGKLGDCAPQAMAGALRKEADAIIEVSRPLVPFDIGTLRDSGIVEEPKVAGTKVSVAFGYGGDADAYALRQHEDMAYHHTEGQAKYLEQPTLAAANGMAERIKAVLEQELFDGAT